MRTIARVFRWLGAALGLLLAILLGAFGVLQTRVGQAWLAKTVAQTVSSPDFAVSVEGFHGIVPFHLTIDRIDIADRDGTYPPSAVSGSIFRQRHCWPAGWRSCR